MNNSKPQESRPFNFEHAKAGAPYGCRDGSKAEVLKWDAKGGEFKLIGYTEPNGSEVPESWTKHGNASARGESHADLVMLPLGEIEGKPVFYGDKIMDCNDLVEAKPGCHDFKYCSWPAPEKQYPVTGMSGEELHKVYVTEGKGIDSGMVAVANAAIRHAIDSGAVATIEAYDQLRTDVLEAERKYDELRQLVNNDAKRGAFPAYKDTPEGIASAARDMAIAEAVKHAVACHAVRVADGAVIMRHFGYIDLAAIISKVTK
jgi:hypothetical protein